MRLGSQLAGKATAWPEVVARSAQLAYARSVFDRVHHARRLLLCMLAGAVLCGVWASSSSAATTAAKGAAPTSGSSSLLESSAASSKSGGTSGGTASTPAGGEEEEGAEGTEASKKTAASRTSASEESGSFGSLPIIFGMGGAAILIGAIATFIVRDARRSAPVPEGGISNASTRMSAHQLRKRRSKAKAVKQQRKKNRPG